MVGKWFIVSQLLLLYFNVLIPKDYSNTTLCHSRLHVMQFFILASRQWCSLGFSVMECIRGLGEGGYLKNGILLKTGELGYQHAKVPKGPGKQSHGGMEPRVSQSLTARH